MKGVVIQSVVAPKLLVFFVEVIIESFRLHN